MQYVPSKKLSLLSLEAFPSMYLPDSTPPCMHGNMSDHQCGTMASQVRKAARAAIDSGDGLFDTINLAQNPMPVFLQACVHYQQTAKRLPEIACHCPRKTQGREHQSPARGLYANRPTFSFLAWHTSPRLTSYGSLTIRLQGQVHTSELHVFNGDPCLPAGQLLWSFYTSLAPPSLHTDEILPTCSYFGLKLYGAVPAP